MQGQISGWLKSVGPYSSRFGGYTFYFFAKSNQPVDALNSGE